MSVSMVGSELTSGTGRTVRPETRSGNKAVFFNR